MPSHRRLVDDIVVHQCRRVDELNGGGDTVGNGVVYAAVPTAEQGDDGAELLAADEVVAVLHVGDEQRFRGQVVAHRRFDFLQIGLESFQQLGERRLLHRSMVMLSRWTISSSCA